MRKTFISLLSLMVFAAFAFVAPTTSYASKGKKTVKAEPALTGKVSAVDTTAATVTVGKTTVNITSETKITKDGKPATLADITVGEKIGGAYKKDEAGKMNAVSIRIGEKPEKEGKKTKPEAKE